MDHSQYYKKEREGYSVYFPNRMGLEKDQITEIFSQFGRVLSVNITGDQYGLRFVRYPTLDEVIACLEGMRNHKLIKLSKQQKKYQTNSTEKYNKPKPSNGKPSKLYETLNQTQIEQTFSTNKSNIYNSTLLENGSYMKPSITKDNEIIPSLISIDKLNKFGSQSSLASSTQDGCKSPKQNIISAAEVVVANIPPAFSIHYILHLFRQQNPIAVSFMTKIAGTSLQYCHVYFKKPEQALAIEKKFNHNIISGHNLIVLRPNKLLEEIVSL